MDTEGLEDDYDEEVVEEVRYKSTNLDVAYSAGLLAGPMNRDPRYHSSQQFSVHLPQYSWLELALISDHLLPVPLIVQYETYISHIHPKPPPPPQINPSYSYQWLLIQFQFHNDGFV